MNGQEIMESELNQLEEIILSKVQQRTPPRMNEDTYIVKAFRHHDLGNTGWCEFDKFKKALVPFSSGVQEQDLQAIFNRYAPEGQMHYKSFAQDFVSGVRRIPGLSTDARGEAWETVEDTLMRIKVFVYSQGPAGIINMATAFHDSDMENSRSLSYDAFCAVMTDFFAGTDCPLQDESIDLIFQVFRQPYAPGQIAYDELFLALKEEPSPDRRHAIRAAFRRLDPHSESLVDINHMIRSFNASRHPQVSDGTRQPDEVMDEFSTTMKDLVAFRRGQRSYPTNLVAWEEFEDYYKFTCGCYETDAQFCTTLTRVWDLDKTPDHSIEARKHTAAPAAGLPPRSRAGLHHWQENTLPKNPHTVHKDPVNLPQVFARARAQVAKQGLRGAIDVVKAFYAADDDIDDMLDMYEFRKACKDSKLGFNPAEEKAIFEALGEGEASSKGAKLQVQGFLEQLQGVLPESRLSTIKQAWAAVGGDPEDEAQTLSPSVLKDNYACQMHPNVARGELPAAMVMNEFLDTFSLLAHVRGGCQDGMVAFSDFLAYYQVVSSLADNDAYFNMLLKRLWISKGDSPNGSPNGGAPARSSPTAAMYEAPPLSPAGGTAAARKLARGETLGARRPPPHVGPSAYATAPQPVDQQHRRFLRKEMPGLADGYPDAENGGPREAWPPAAPMTGQSPITKSSIVFNEADTSEIGTVVKRLRQALAKRGLKSWKALAEKFVANDNRKNGGIMRMDFERLHKTLGLGLAPEERDALFKGLSYGRKDGSMDYRECMRRLRGQLAEEQQALVEDLYKSMEDEAGVDPEELKARFDPRHSPAHILQRKDANSVATDFYDVVDYFCGGDRMDLEAFTDFFRIIAAANEDGDAFHLMTTAAFGLPN